MNTRIKKSIIGIACVIGGLLFQHATTDKANESITTFLQLENIEALGAYEGGGSYFCYGSGSVHCKGYYVRIAIY